MNNKLNPTERAHLSRIKEMECACCGAPGPSDCHHVEQHMQWTVIPLCKDCHTGSHNGIHGRKQIWAVLRKTEMSCLNDTVRRLLK